MAQVSHESGKDRDVSSGVFCTHAGSLPQYGASPLGEAKRDAGDLGRETLGIRMGMSDRKTGKRKEENSRGGRAVVWEGKELRHFEGKKILQQAGKVKKAKAPGHQTMYGPT